MITVIDLHVAFDEREILKGINLELRDGDNLIVLGKSGSGKTVLIKTLMGLLRPSAGKVIIDDVDIHASAGAQVSQVREKISMVFQNAALLDSYTVFQNVALPLYEREKLSFDAIREKVLECLELVGLSHTVDMYPAELSGGMRKRIGIARSLIYEPEWIIFDEPISGLDPVTAKEILFYMSKIIRAKKVTSITITHDLKDLRNLGNMVLFLQDGQQRFYGKIDELFRTTDPEIQRFIGGEA